jgi:hypothetical protein
VSGGTTGLE